MPAAREAVGDGARRTAGAAGDASGADGAENRAAGGTSVRAAEGCGARTLTAGSRNAANRAATQTAWRCRAGPFGMARQARAAMVQTSGARSEEETSEL